MCTVNAQQPLCPLGWTVLRDAHLYAPRGAAHQFGLGPGLACLPFQDLSPQTQIAAAALQLTYINYEYWA